MLSTSELTVIFGQRKLFEDVSIKFTPGNCYGVIGANGAGKSTFLKVLAGEIEPNKGSVHIPSGLSISVLRQDHFQYNDEEVLQTVLLGNERLMEVGRAKDAIYAKPEMSEEDGLQAAELEAEFSKLGGWEAETDAATILNGLGISTEQLNKKVHELKDSEKVKVLLAQALFGQPDLLFLDEPTNHLDGKSILWLEEYLLDYPNTVLVISHDRHFLNKISTHMVDIDYGKIQVYVGNYDFWKESSLLARSLRAQENKKKEQKIKELEAFIRRFSANASKSKQATSRRKQLDKIDLEDMPRSIRKSPHIVFQPEREVGNIVLEVDCLSKRDSGGTLFEGLSFTLGKKDKVLLVGKEERALSALLQVLMGQDKEFQGTFRWGTTTSQAYLPKDYEEHFAGKTENLIDWLRNFSVDQSESFIRSFLGRMLFSGEETKKQAQVLSGGEKVRCMLARMMLKSANILVFDGPTNHLDLESISALNDALIKFPGVVLFTTHDHDFAETVSNRILEIGPQGQLVEHEGSYSDYLNTIS